MYDAVPTRPLLPLTQSPGFARVMARIGVEIDELQVSDGAAVRGHVLMQLRRFPALGRVGLVSRGPVWTGSPDAAALARMFDPLGHPVLLNADGIDPNSLSRAGFLRIMTGATIARIDLGGGPVARRARMHQKWRNRLSRAEAGSLRIRREAMPLDPHHWLLTAEAEQRRTRRYKGLPAAFALAFAEANPDGAQLFTATLQDEAVAAMLFLRHGPTATYHIGHTTETGRAQHAHALLLARAADWLADHGATTLELGTLDTVNAPGLARFKLGSGAQPHLLDGTWLYSRRLAPLLRLF